MLGLGLGFGSAFCWGISDFLGGLTTRSAPLTLVTTLSQAMGMVAIGLAILVVGPEIPSQRDAVLAALGGISVAVAVSAFYSGLAGGTMSVVAPVTSIGVSIPVMFGLVTGDDPSPIQFVGIAAAGAGVVLVSRSTTEAGVGGDPPRRGIVLALIAAFCFGWYFVAQDAVAEADILWMLFLTRVTTVVVLTGVAIWARPSLTEVKGSLPGLLGVGLFDLAGSAAFLLAASEGLLSLVSVLGSLYAVITILLARFILKEHVNRWQRVGVACAMSGVGMIALGS